MAVKTSINQGHIGTAPFQNRVGVVAIVVEVVHARSQGLLVICGAGRRERRRGIVERGRSLTLDAGTHSYEYVQLSGLERTPNSVVVPC